MATVRAAVPDLAVIEVADVAGRAGPWRLLRNIGFLVSSQVATWGLSLLWNIFVPRVLGPTKMGEWVVGVAVSQMIFMALGLGIGTLMIKEIAADRVRAPTIVGAAIVMRLALAPIAFGAVAGYALLLHTSAELTTVISLATATILLQLFSGPLLVGLQSIERMEYNAYAEVLKGLALALCIPLVIAGLGLFSMMLCILVAAVVVLALSWYWYHRHFTIDLNPGFREIRSLAVGSLPYWTTGLVLNFYLWIDSLLLSALAPLEAVGWYGLTTRLMGTLLFVPTILSTAYLPRLVRSWKDSPEALGDEARPPLELVLVLGLPVAAGAALVAPRLISDIYGASYLPAVMVLVPLAFCVPFIYLNIMANQVLVAAGRQLDWTKVMVGAAIVNPALNLVLIPYARGHWNNAAEGAAVALLITEMGMAAMAIALMPRVLNRSSGTRVIKALVATALMSVVVLLLRQHVGLIAQIATGLFTFVLLALALRILSDEQVTTLRAIGHRLRLRILPSGGARP
jgi:O-antigen/teichoic acid export membrane protein